MDKEFKLIWALLVGYAVLVLVGLGFLAWIIIKLLVHFGVI